LEAQVPSPQQTAVDPVQTLPQNPQFERVVDETQLPPQQMLVPVPHGLSLVTCEQAWLSVTEELPQPPPEQSGEVTVRVWVPVVAHSVAKEHGPQAPTLTVPQETPSVARGQAWLSVEVALPQPPPEQTGVVTVRVWVPLVAQVEANEQAPHAPALALPQETPSVAREQVWLSLVTAFPQPPFVQSGEVTLRVWVPEVVQVDPNEQALQPP
jgi:hypothetical protein